MSLEQIESEILKLPPEEFRRLADWVAERSRAGEGVRPALPPGDVPPIEPRDDWERLLLSVARDCGVSLSNEALSSEGIYD